MNGDVCFHVFTLITWKYPHAARFRIWEPTRIQPPGPEPDKSSNLQGGYASPEPRKPLQSREAMVKLMDR